MDISTVKQSRTKVGGICGEAITIVLDQPILSYAPLLQSHSNHRYRRIMGQ